MACPGAMERGRLHTFFTTGGLSMAQNSDKVVSMALQNG
jgi:hypothetical protein